MALSNLGFETAGSGAGEAASWTVTVTATAERLGLFAGLSGALLEEETFTEGWGADSYLFQLVPLIDTELGSFDSDSTAYVTQGVEDFEEGWSSNHAYAFNQASVEDGTEDGFSSGWGTTYTSQSAVEDGIVESFTTGWGADSYLFNQGSVEAGLVDTLDGENPGTEVESFENTAIYQQRIGLADLGENSIHFPSPHGLAYRDMVTFYALRGKLPAPLNENVPYFVDHWDGMKIRVCIDQTMFNVVTLTSTGEGECFMVGDPRRYWLTGTL